MTDHALVRLVPDEVVPAISLSSSSMLSHHRPAATLAFVNGAMVLGMSMLTDYPGGIFRTLSFRTHGTGDIVQAALAGLGPILMWGSATIRRRGTSTASH